MSTIVTLPDQSTATLPKVSYLNKEYGLKSWLLTGDHKRIAMLYLISITFFFFIGGAMAGLIRLELLTPPSDLLAADTYNKVFTAARPHHGVPLPGAVGAGDDWKLPDSDHGGGEGPGVSEDQPAELVPVCCRPADDVGALAFGGVDTGWTFTTPLSTHYLNTHVITAATGGVSSPDSVRSSPG